ncbi:hypothetical protein F7725_025249 [Dissostichus mawsoni]|uniref:Uncharacterized protein n=1 Tax=Dissostichus mawsoni TaxID=36200 RepID=A0A7J5XAL6_DISMA|nr:hypothetical protein F7725_025249 [Dissostichus mawsoni]
MVKGRVLDRHVAMLFSAHEIPESERPSPHPPPRALLQEITDIYGSSGGKSSPRSQEEPSSSQPPGPLGRSLFHAERPRPSCSCQERNAADDVVVLSWDPDPPWSRSSESELSASLAVSPTISSICTAASWRALK